jgi:hypothetical protein
MAGVAAAVLATVAKWLGDGRLAIGDGHACSEHVDVLCAVRITHRWNMHISMQMLVSIHAGRVSWIHSTYLMMRDEQDEAIANLEVRLRVAGDEVQRLRTQAAADIFHLADLRAREFGLTARVDAIEEELRIREEIIDDLRVEVIELNEAVSAARRADRPEPDPELEP